MGSAGTVDVDLQVRTKNVMSAMMSQMNTVAKQMEKTMGVVGAKVDQGLTKPLKSAHVAASTTYGYLKDIGRIVQGIFISQVLYRGILQPIQEAVKEIWKFNMELERTELSFKYLLQATEDLTEGTEKLADALMKTLKILAAQTPFIMSTVTSAAQTLLSLGFKVDELKPILTLMADLSAATGGAADQMEKLARGLGYIQQRGRMTMKEFILFSTAKVPIMDILEKELGFEGLPTKMHIPSEVIIPAILKYIMRFKGAAADMENSMSGLLSSIHDYFLFIAEDIFKDFFDAIKDKLRGLRKGLAELWDIYERFGMKQVLVNFLPHDVALAVWQFIHLIQALGQTLSALWERLAPLRNELAKIGMIINNYVITGFIIFFRILEDLVRIIIPTAESTRVLGATIAGLVVAFAASMALTSLIKIMQKLILFTNKTVAILAALLGLLTALLLMIPKVRNWFSNLGNTILNAFGIQIPQSIWTARKAIAGMGSDLDNIDWQQLIDGFSETGDEAAEAGKKINDTFLASFDEVYNIPEKASASGLGSMFGGLEGLGDFEIPDIGGFDPSKLFEDFMNEDLFVKDTENMLQKIWRLWIQYVDWWWNTFLDGWGVVIDIAKNGWQLIIDIYKGMFFAMHETLDSTITYLASVITDVSNLISQILLITSETLMKLAILFGEALGASAVKIGELLAIIGEIIIAFFATVGETVTTGIGTIASIVLGGLELISSTFGSALALIVDIVSSGVGAIGEIFVALITYIKKPTIAGFKEMAANVSGIVGGWIDDTAGKITGWAGNTNKSFEDFKTGSTGKLEAWKKNTVGLWDTFGTETNTKLTTWKGEFVGIWETWKTESETVVENATTELTTVWDTFKADTKENFEIWTGEVGKIWTDYFGEVEKGWNDFISDSKEQLLEYNINVLGGVESLLGNIASAFTSNKQELKDSVWTYWQGAIESQRRAFKELSNMPRPSVNVPGYSSGGIVNVPHAASGMVVGRDQLIRVGEGGDSEMIAPLNKTSMKPFADMIGSLINSNSGQSQESDYIMVPVNKRDLERDLFVIRQQEILRRGV